MTIPNPDAFPRPDYVQRDKDGDIVDVIEYPGMTLRDYFAAKAMAAVMNPSKGEFGYDEDKAGEPCRTWPHFASAAYKMADAMLAERVK